MLSNETMIALKAMGGSDRDLEKLEALKQYGFTDDDIQGIVQEAQTTQKEADAAGITFKSSPRYTAFKASPDAKHTLKWLDEMIKHKAETRPPNVNQQIDLTLEATKLALDALQRSRGDDAVLRVLDRIKATVPNIESYLQQ